MTGWDTVLGEAALGLDLARADLVWASPDRREPACRDGRSAETLPGRPWDPPAGLASAISGLAPASDGARAPRRRAARRGGRETDFRRPPRVHDQPRPHARQPDAALSPAGPGARSLRPAGPPQQLPGSPAAPADGRDSIFRREALEFRARGRDTAGGVVRLGPWWVRWSYRLALVAVVASLASLWLIRTDESASGPAVIDGRTGTVAALLPAAAGPELAGSPRLTVALPSGRSVEVSIRHEQLASDAAARKAGLAPPAQPAILVTGQLAEGPPARPAARDTRLPANASVVLRSESLAGVLARQFRTMLSQGTGP